MTATPQALPQPLRRLFGTVLERALARALALDPATRTALGALEGRRLRLEMPAPAVALSVTVEQGRLRVGPPQPVGEDDLAITATLGAALSQAAPWRDPAAPPVGKVRLAGDAELARRVQSLVQQFDPDWDAALASTFGEVAGHQLGKALRAGRRFARDSAVALARDSADYLVDGSRDLVAAAELAQFCDDVDALRDRIERLEARLRHLLPAAPTATGPAPH